MSTGELKENYSRVHNLFGARESVTSDRALRSIDGMIMNMQSPQFSRVDEPQIINQQNTGGLSSISSKGGSRISQ
jgi:hypothetical protein